VFLLSSFFLAADAPESTLVVGFEEGFTVGFDSNVGFDSGFDDGRVEGVGFGSGREEGRLDGVEVEGFEVVGFELEPLLFDDEDDGRSDGFANRSAAPTSKAHDSKIANFFT